MYLNEPLPECGAQIQNKADKRNVITAAHNCAVSVKLVENGREETKFVKINNTDLDTISSIKRKKHFEIASTLLTDLQTNDIVFIRNKNNDVSSTQ